MAISVFFYSYEIASVVSLPRNDSMTQPHKGETILDLFSIDGRVWDNQLQLFSFSFRTAWAAASLAIGNLKGEQLT